MEAYKIKKSMLATPPYYIVLTLLVDRESSERTGDIGNLDCSLVSDGAVFLSVSLSCVLGSEPGPLSVSELLTGLVTMLP